MALHSGRSFGLACTARRVSGGVALVVLAVGLAAGAAEASPPRAGGSAMFSLSPMRAAAVPGQSATRYSVTLARVPADDAPTFSWYLHLRGGGAACSDAALAGGRRLSAGEYVWVNQQSSFVWYTGAAGSYPGDRSYGCDQADLGRGGYPGTVTLVVENEYQHCSASFAGIAPGGQARSGAAATCALGGYSLGASTLPVPATLIALYRRFDAEVTGLILQARQHTITTATLAAALESIRGQQQSAFARLFPPVWGCSFDGLFDGVSVAKASLDAQTAQLASGSLPSAASLAGDRIDLQSLARGLAACRATATSSGGAPKAVIRAVQRLLTEVSGLGGARSGARRLAYLRARLPAIDSGLDSVVSRSFPTVYGMSYIDLVERTLTVETQAGLALQAVAGGDDAATASSLAGILGPEQATGQALRQQAKRVVAAENRNS